MTAQEFATKQSKMLNSIPEAFRCWLSKKAWDDGHALGHTEVICHLEDLIDGLKECLGKDNTTGMQIVSRKKITVGFVIQTYDDCGDCVSQEFIAGDQVDWENEKGGFIPTPVHNYQSFDMVQP